MEYWGRSYGDASRKIVQWFKIENNSFNIFSHPDILAIYEAKKYKCVAVPLGHSTVTGETGD